MISSARMDIGLIFLMRGMYGSRTANQDLLLIRVADIGHIPIMAGPGYLIILMAGLLSIMEGGILMMITVGIGYRNMSGLRLGLHGREPQDIMVGHH